MTGRVLVTGGNGRLGRAVLAALGDRGVGGVRGEGINGAIAIDSAGTVDAARLAGIDAVINCANLVSGTQADIEQANRLYAVAVARRARAAGVGRFVQVSSFSIYGDAERIDGETSLAPQTDYARSKLAAEHELADLATRDFRVVSLRLPFMFSASEPALLGKLVTAMLKLRMVPVPRGSASRRSMITYGARPRRWQPWRPHRSRRRVCSSRPTRSRSTSRCWRGPCARASTRGSRSCRCPPSLPGLPERSRPIWSTG
ncbi:NAD-dependent epimerase/dehydratase family protein [Sphingomonas aerolata]|uniref:NAD-dependent epimerase/dehydratase family protein n=1 Tax=Sphingomonas aerolata TaxID=185951 RepID=UPI002FE0673A